MPIAFDATATIDICLRADEDRPVEQRVYFRCRYITDRERRKVWELRKRLRETTSDEETDALITQALAVGVVGPVNAKDRDGAPLACTVDAVADVLSYVEMLALIDEYPLAVALGEMDKKKSASPSPSPSIPAAPVEAAASA